MDEEDAKHIDGYICEFCSFDDPNGVFLFVYLCTDSNDEEEEYVFEKSDSPKRKRSRYDYHHSSSSHRMVTLLGKLSR